MWTVCFNGGEVLGEGETTIWTDVKKNVKLT